MAGIEVDTKRIEFISNMAQSLVETDAEGNETPFFSLKFFINTKSMANREYAEELNRKCDEMLAVYTVKADEIFRNVLGRLKA